MRNDLSPIRASCISSPIREIIDVISGTGGLGHIWRISDRAISSTIEMSGDTFCTSGSWHTLNLGLTRLPFSIYSLIVSGDVKDLRAVQIGSTLLCSTFAGIANAYPPIGAIGEPFLPFGREHWFIERFGSVQLKQWG